MKSDFSTWTDFRQWLDGLGLFHMELDLERIRRGLALAALEEPGFPIIQVVGTNGKGSTATFLAALARAHGLKTGLFTSPHFLSPRERIRINGKMLTRDQWLDAARFLARQLSGKVAPTYFEFLTLLAMRLFAMQRVDLAVFEAGLGGRHDATSALKAQICCFTPIAIDHAAILGSGLKAIARDKAAAMAGKTLAFSAPQFPEAEAILKETAATQDVPLQLANVLDGEDASALALAGSHQKVNAALALTAWRALARDSGIASEPAKEKKALGHAFIAGRMQYIPGTDGHPAFILDGSHNPHAARALAGELPRISGLIFSALADKDWQTSLAMLCRAPAFPVLVPQLENSRAEKAEKIKNWLNSSQPGRAMAINGPFAMLRALGRAAGLPGASAAPVLICGSLYVLAAFYKLFPFYLHENGDDNDDALRA